MTIRFTNARPAEPPPGISPDDMERLLRSGERVMEWLRENEDHPRRLAEAPRQVLERICPELAPLLARLPLQRFHDPRQPAPPFEPGSIRFAAERGGAR